MREYLNPVIKADECAQTVNNIDITAILPEQLITNLRAVFQCIQNAVLKLSMARCHCGTTAVDFLRRTITPKGVTPQKQKCTKLLGKIKTPRSKKSIHQYIGFLKHYHNHIPHLAERLNPFFQFLKTTEKKDEITITPELLNEFGQADNVLSKGCQLALRQPLPDNQLTLLTNASFQVAGSPITDPNGEFTSTRKRMPQ